MRMRWRSARYEKFSHACFPFLFGNTYLLSLHPILPVRNFALYFSFYKLPRKTLAADHFLPSDYF